MLKQVADFGRMIGLNIDNMENGLCVKCNEPFSDKNVHSQAGWKDTKINGFCEDCFDKLFEGEEEEDEP